MTNAPVSQNLMTLEDFVRCYDREGPFEILDGERITMTPTTLGHNSIADNLMFALNTHIRPKKLGKVFPESPFVLTEEDDWVKGARVPDVMVVVADRFATYQETHPNWENEPLRIVPDLAVEIISPTDSYQDVERKVHTYLTDGVRLVWVINPCLQTITVHVQGSNQQTTLSREDTLSGDTVIPGFAITVSALFE